MKKLLKLLPLLLILPALSYGLYDDFSGDESYYEGIDDCVSLAPHSVTWLADTASTGATNLTIGTGSTGITSLQFDKIATNNFHIFGNGIYPTVTTNQRNITGLNDGYATCLLSVPTISGAGITQVKIEMTSSTIITSGTKLTGTKTASISTTTTGFTYIKSGTLTGSATDYANIQSASVSIIAGATTFSGAQISDIRVVSKNNTTNGVWNEGSGIWEIFKVAGDTIYFNIDAAGSSSAAPQLFTKAQYKDFIYSAKFKVLTDTTATEAGLIFRYSPVDYYKFVVDPGPNASNIAVFRLKRINTDTATATVTSTAFDADTSGTALTGNSFWLKAEVKGSNIKTYYATKAAPTTWVPVFNYTDTNPIQYGYVGVVCDKKYAIDNVEVIPAPSAPAANGGDNKVTVAWTKDYSYIGEISGYNIYRSTTAGTYGVTPYAATTGTSYVDSAVVNGTSYYYKVTSIISTGASTTDELPIAYATEVNANPHPGVQIANNPFMPNSANAALNKVKFTVYNPLSAPTVLKVYQPTGVLVKTVSGADSIIYWDGTNTGGSIVEGGVYVWQITVDNAVAGSGTMVLAK